MIHPAALTLFILYFPNKTRRICSGSSSYNTGPLLGREGVAQNIPSGRNEFSNLLWGMLVAILKTSTCCGSCWNPPCSELIARALLPSASLVNIRSTIETVPLEQVADAAARGKEGKR